MSCCGPFNRLVTIQSQTLAKDSRGGQAVTWGTYCTLWCKVEQKKAWERQVNGQHTATPYIRLTSLYRTGINETMRAILNGKAYNIRGIDNPLQANKWTTLDVEGGIPT